MNRSRFASGSSGGFCEPLGSNPGTTTTDQVGVRKIAIVMGLFLAAHLEVTFRPASQSLVS